METTSLPRRRLLAAALSLAAAGGASAQAAFPSRPVQLVVPFAAGGATDSLGRMLAQKLSDRWKQPVVVDNKPGATGAIGSQFVARAPADGYTLLLGTGSTHAVAPAVNPKLPYKLAEFAPVSLLATFPNLLVVHPSVPAKTVPELVAVLKARPGQLNFASTGNGGTVHLAGELFKLATKTEMVHVPFKGSGAAIGELLAGRVELAFDNIPTMLPHVRAGKLRALGVTGPRRLATLPDVPAVAETVPGFEATTWVGVFAPAGTPAAVVRAIAAEIDAVMTQPEVRDKLAGEGAVAVGGAPEAFGRFVESDSERWRQVVKAANITASE
jgi:tripartite-type tricarboxylate transporter receptor subunit TctC